MRYRNICFSLMHCCMAIYVCLNSIIKNKLLGGRANPGRCSLRKNHGSAQSTVIQLHELHTCTHEINSHHSALENAIKTLNTFMLFAILSPAFSPLRIPTIMTRIRISPMEEMVKEMFKTQLRERDLNSACLSQLNPYMNLIFYGEVTQNIYLFPPMVTS
jgi:hypothetical protein